MEAQIQNEVTFYKDSFVRVTQSRYVTQSKTYAMRNISSVHIFEIIKSRAKAVFLMIFGLFFLLSKDIFWVGLIIIALGIWWLTSIKNEYTVRISTNAGEADSIVSTNRDYIQKIVNALNDAIIHRG
ncbi:hypothetical protein M2347_001251 [Chryseobacterium sp. H1D6B]|uniref:DUF6232 family protein n=1 Tax=Chryseobacterium sp. H1D6B TaxID=2940588 RepID=UPI0015CD92E9|nr:DUF6232 family protein [Chryseobacterium sp. H1D6B]MDH6251524.1 hypothetical protein [Chryseobacterium sp. H1D6B]